MATTPFSHYLARHVLCLTVLAISLKCVACKTNATGFDSKLDDSDLETIIRRLKHMEDRDLVHERDNKMLRHQLTSYREELAVQKTKNDVLVDRVRRIEADNKELRNRLNDAKIAIETVCGNNYTSSDDHAELQSSFSSIENLSKYYTFYMSGCWFVYNGKD